MPRCTLVGSFFVSLSSFWRPFIVLVPWNGSVLQPHARGSAQSAPALPHTLAVAACGCFVRGVHADWPAEHAFERTPSWLPSNLRTSESNSSSPTAPMPCLVSQPPANPGMCGNRRPCSLQNIRWCSSTTCLPWTRFSAGLRLSVLKRRKKWKRCWIVR